MASVGKRQEKQARETMKLREKDSKKQDKERENYRKLSFQANRFLMKDHTCHTLNHTKKSDVRYRKRSMQDISTCRINNALKN